MIDFLKFNLFSILELVALLLLICSVFNINVKYYKTEIIVCALAIGLLSYLLVIFGVHKVIPLPVIEIPILILFFKYVFGQKWKWSIFVSIAGFIFLGVLEIGILLLSVQMQYLQMSDVQDAFQTKGYIIQTIASIIIISIAIYVKLFNEGFGFSFRKGKFKLFLYTTIAAIILICLTFYAFIISDSYSSLLALFISLAISAIIMIYLSIKRDEYEFSDIAN
jgi:hypothetical protein